MSGFMDCCGMTDIGRIRTSNEDQFLIADVSKSMRVHQTSLALDHQTRLFGNTQGKILVVADGMGGHEAGERASQLATDGVVDYVLNRLSWFMADSCHTAADFEEQLKRALISCQDRIDREIAAAPQRQGMGSTLTMAYIVWPKLFLVHVGDTRCYLLRDGVLEQLTRDHTLADLASAVYTTKGPQAVDDEAEDAKPASRPLAHVLWNAIGGGTGKAPHPDAQAVELRIGDTLLLCSDGLSGLLSRKQLREITSQEIATDAICAQLIAAANEAGGKDNITVIVSRFVDRVAPAAMSEEVEIPLVKTVADTVEFEPSGTN